MKSLRKCLVTFLGILTVLAVALFAAACGSDGKVTLSFVTDVTDTSAPYDELEVAEGEEVPLPTPEREGFEFEGWYPDSSLTGDPVQSPVVAESDATYYAKWSPLPAITLNLDGGTLSKTTLYLKAGENLAAFLSDYVPTKTNREFGEWLADGTPLAENAVMPSEGIALTAHWKVPYTINIYKQDLSLDSYEQDNALTVKGFDYVGETVSAGDSIEHFTLNTERSASVVLEEKDDNAVAAYYDRELYYVVYNANDASLEGESEMQSYPYGTDVAIRTGVFTVDGCHFVGWATEANGEAEYFADDVIDAIDRTYVLYAVWDSDRYADTLGGTDYLFRDKKDYGVVYLLRKGLPEVQGIVDENGYFTFTGKDFSLRGQLNDAKRTFVYLTDALQGDYGILDSYLGAYASSTVLSIGEYDRATLRFYEPGETATAHGDLLKEINGTYALEDPYWGEFGIYTFHATTMPEEGDENYEKFNFRLGMGTLSDETTVRFFAMQGTEATNGSDGQYLTLDESRQGFGFPVLVVDGFGGCAYYASATSSANTAISYTPASYIANYAYAAENEFVILTSASTLFGHVRLRVEQGYTQDHTPVDVGVFDVNDGSTGPYNCTYTDENGNEVTERFYMDGFGGAVYFGKVTVGDDGSEQFEFEKQCTYAPDFTSFYPIIEEEDDEGSVIGVSCGSPVSYNRTIFTDADGNQYVVSVTSTPVYRFDRDTQTGTWSTGVISKLDKSAGLYAVDSSKRIQGAEVSSSGVPGNRYPYYLSDLQLYVTGAPRLTASGSFGTAENNYAELWGSTGFNVDGHDTFERICSGNLLPTEDKTADGLTIYELTVKKANISTSKGGYAVNTVIRICFREDGTAVFAETDPLTFTAADGAVFKIDEFGNISFEKDGAQAVPADLTKSTVGDVGIMYSFTAGELTYDFFRPNTAPEDNAGIELLGGIFVQDHSNAVGLYGWNAGYRANGVCTTARIVMLNDTDVLLYVFYEELSGGTVVRRTHIFYGQLSAVEGEEGVYQFTKKDGPTKTIPSFSLTSLKIKFLDEDTFAIYTNKLELNATDADGATLKADGFGTATYTDKEGAAHTGELQLVLDYSKSAGIWDDTENKRDTTKGLYLYRIVEADGTVWNFSVENVNGSYDSADNRKTFRVAGDYAGVYWIIENNNGNGAMSSNYYFYDGLHVYQMAGNSGNSVQWIGHVDSIVETETGANFTLTALYSSNASVQTKQLALRLKPGASGKEWHLAFVYDESYDLDYEAVDDEGNVIGHLKGDGYDFMNLTYTDDKGEVYMMRVTDFNAEAKYVTIQITQDGENVRTLTFDLLEENKLWLRTSLAMVAVRNNRQLHDARETLTADGHGHAVYSVAGNEIEGTYEQIEGSLYAFKSADGNISFRYTLYVSTGGALSDTTFYFSIQTEGYTGYYYETERFTTVWLNDDETAVYYDEFGVVHNASYNLLGENKSLLEVYGNGIGYRYFHISYTADGAPMSEIVPVEGDYAYIDNVIYGYQGGAEAAPLPAGVDTIAFGAFYQKPVVTIDLTGITTLEPYAFAESASLATVKGAEGIETVGAYAFYDCLALKEIDLSGAKTIGTYGMGNTISIVSLSLDSIEQIDAYAFASNYGALDGSNPNHPKFREVHIGEHIEHIGSHAFHNIHAFARDGVLSVYLHTGADADYDNLITEDGVFYQTEIALYVDSVEVVKAIYNSQMATRYRSTGAQQAYHQLIRIASDGSTEEYGYYIRADYTATTASDAQIVRLDGMLADGDGATSKVYRNLCYVKDGETLHLIGYDAAQPQKFVEETATLTEAGGVYKLTINDLSYVKLGDDGLVYTNGEDTLAITGKFTVTNGTFSVALSGVYTRGETKVTGDLTKKTGCLEMSKTSTYKYQFALKNDLTFTVPTAEDEFNSPNSSATERIKVTTTTAADGTQSKVLSFGTNGKVCDAIGQLAPESDAHRSYVEALNLGSTSYYEFVETPTFEGDTITAHVKSKNSSTKDYEWIFTFTINEADHTYTVEIELIYGVKTFEGYHVEGDETNNYGFKVVLDSRDDQTTRMTGVTGMTYRKIGATTAFSNASSVSMISVGENKWLVYSTSSSTKHAFILTYTPATDDAEEKLEIAEEVDFGQELTLDAADHTDFAKSYGATFFVDANGNALTIQSFALDYYTYTTAGAKNENATKLSYTGTNLIVTKTAENTFDIEVKGYVRPLSSSTTTTVVLHFTVVYIPARDGAEASFSVTWKDDIIIKEATGEDGTQYRAMFLKSNGTTTMLTLEYKGSTAGTYTKATLNSSGAAQSDGSFSAYSGSSKNKITYTVKLEDDTMTVTAVAAS